MAYDMDETVIGTPVARPAEKKADPKDRVSPRDLETIVTLMEIAGLCLTDEPGKAFTVDQLKTEMRSLAEDIAIEDRDIDIVLGMGGVFRKGAGGTLSLR